MTEERKCRECRKPFKPSRHSQVFCSESCYEKYHELRRLERLKSRKELVCDFCKTKFQSKAYSRFCDKDCAEAMNRIASRLRNIFGFETEPLMRELERLESKGKNYRFPHPHEEFNAFYGLTHPLEGVNDDN